MNSFIRPMSVLMAIQPLSSIGGLRLGGATPPEFLSTPIQPLSSIGGLRPELQYLRRLPLAIQPLSSIGGLRLHRGWWSIGLASRYSALIQHRRIATVMNFTEES